MDCRPRPRVIFDPQHVIACHRVRCAQIDKTQVCRPRRCSRFPDVRPGAHWRRTREWRAHSFSHPSCLHVPGSPVSAPHSVAFAQSSSPPVSVRTGIRLAFIYRSRRKSSARRSPTPLTRKHPLPSWRNWKFGIRCWKRRTSRARGHVLSGLSPACGRRSSTLGAHATTPIPRF